MQDLGKETAIQPVHPMWKRQLGSSFVNAAVCPSQSPTLELKLLRRITASHVCVGRLRVYVRAGQSYHFSHKIEWAGACEITSSVSSNRFDMLPPEL